MVDIYVNQEIHYVLVVQFTITVSITINLLSQRLIASQNLQVRKMSRRILPSFIVVIGLLIAILSSLFLTGCSRRISPQMYSENHIHEASLTYRGVIIDARKVKVCSEKLEENIVGTALGSIAGNAIGYQLGRGDGNLAITVAGTVIGGIIGNLIEDKISTQDAIEYIIELSNGPLKTVIQGKDVKLSPNDHVLLILGHKGRPRIIFDRSSE